MANSFKYLLNPSRISESVFKKYIKVKNTTKNI